MHKSKSSTQLVRSLNSDLWGGVLYSRKPLKPLFREIYNPYQRRPANFVLRVDIMRPKKKKKIQSRYALAIKERRKLAAFYGLTLEQLRHLCLRARHSGSNNFIKTFFISLDLCYIYFVGELFF